MMFAYVWLPQAHRGPHAAQQMQAGFVDNGVFIPIQSTTPLVTTKRLKEPQPRPQRKRNFPFRGHPLHAVAPRILRPQHVGLLFGQV
jgi:hypothetical protein